MPIAEETDALLRQIRRARMWDQERFRHDMARIDRDYDDQVRNVGSPKTLLALWLLAAAGSAAAALMVPLLAE